MAAKKTTGDKMLLLRLNGLVASAVYMYRTTSYFFFFFISLLKHSGGMEWGLEGWGCRKGGGGEGGAPCWWDFCWTQPDINQQWHCLEGSHGQLHRDQLELVFAFLSAATPSWARTETVNISTTQGKSACFSNPWKNASFTRSIHSFPCLSIRSRRHQSAMWDHKHTLRGQTSVRLSITTHRQSVLQHVCPYFQSKRGSALSSDTTAKGTLLKIHWSLSIWPWRKQSSLMRGHHQHVFELLNDDEKLGPPEVLKVHDLLKVVASIEVGVETTKQLEVFHVAGSRALQDCHFLCRHQLLQVEGVQHVPQVLVVLPHRWTITLHLWDNQHFNENGSWMSELKHM